MDREKARGWDTCIQGKAGPDCTYSPGVAEPHELTARGLTLMIYEMVSGQRLGRREHFLLGSMQDIDVSSWQEYV